MVSEIKQRINALLYPHFDEIIENLDYNEVDYFINHIKIDFEKSLKHWEYKQKIIKHE